MAICTVTLSVLFPAVLSKILKLDKYNICQKAKWQEFVISIQFHEKKNTERQQEKCIFMHLQII